MHGHLSRTAIVLLIAAELLLHSCRARFYTDEHIIGDLTEYIERIMEKQDIPGLAISLVAGEDIVWEKGFGVSNLESMTPVTPETYFRVGSVSKSVTALGIMKLHADGRLDIDDPLAGVLPQFSIRYPFGDYSEITVRHVLSHRSGIPDSLVIGSFSGLPDAAILNVISAKTARFAAGTRYEYTNLGYSLLGLVVEEITGMRFNDYMRSDVLPFLGMPSSSYFATPLIREGLSSSYGAADDEEMDNFDVSGVAMGNLYSNLDEMTGFLLFCLNDQEFLPGSLKESMFRDHYSRREEYGLGFMLDRFGSVRKVGHPGGIQRFRSYLYFLPEEKVGAVLLCNTSRIGQYGIIGKKPDYGERIVDRALKLLAKREVHRSEDAEPERE